MRLGENYPAARYVTVFLDGVEQTRCYESDDVAGIALIGVRDADGKDIAAIFHREWQPGEWNYGGLVVRWVRGLVELRFDTDEHRQQAEAEQRIDHRVYPPEPLRYSYSTASAASVAEQIRDEVIRQVRAGGGSVEAYFGGKPQT